MNLIKMMNAAGIGCGKDCRCVRSFAESLGETQQVMLGHMIEQGAKKRHKKIKNAERAKAADEQSQGDDVRRGPSLSGFMNQLFADAFGPDRQNKLDPLGVILRAMGRRNMNDSTVESYAGELTENQLTKLATIDEEIRLTVEATLRKFIAFSANNDPNRVIMKMLEDGTGVEFEVDMRADDEGQEPAPAAEDAAAA